MKQQTTKYRYKKYKLNEIGKLFFKDADEYFRFENKIWIIVVILAMIWVLSIIFNLLGVQIWR